jgi:hypothetical protein
LCLINLRISTQKQIDDVEELPSLDAVMSEMDSDIDSINSLLADNKLAQTPTPSFDDRNQTGSLLRHVIFQGVTAQIGSAAVSELLILTCKDIKYLNYRIEPKLVSQVLWPFREWWQ